MNLTSGGFCESAVRRMNRFSDQLDSKVGNYSMSPWHADFLRKIAREKRDGIWHLIRTDAELTGAVNSDGTVKEDMVVSDEIQEKIRDFFGFCDGF